jgi:polysaccharide pyruvyl transferase WcaK-like protein
LKLAFEALHDRVHIHIRDEVSFERFKSFCNAKAKLVADAAFQLIPDAQAQVVQELADWTRLQKEAGRRVVGFNIHPMLLHDPSPSQLDQLIEQVASALDAYLNRAPVALVLISHDYRTTVGDDVCLQPLWKRLSVRFGDRIHYDRSICSAAELKAKAGLMDGVVTGRMHFAIACLGMAVPVAALTYQDKFQGLMKHVDLPQDLLLQPSDLADPDKLVILMLRFHDDMATLRARVEARVPAVMAASALNVAPLIGV